MTKEMLFSACIYLSVFAVCTGFFFHAEKAFEKADSGEKKRRWTGILSAVIGILILSVFAGIRANSVGVDTQNYPDLLMWKAGRADSFGKFYDSGIISHEPLGALLVWFCSRITDNAALLLFFWQFFTVVPFFLAAYQMRRKCSITLSMLVYLLLIFNNSLNLSRQSMAVAFVLLGVVLLDQKKQVSIRVILCFFLACTLHVAGILDLVFVLTAYLLIKRGRSSMKGLLYGLILVYPFLLNTITPFLLQESWLDANIRTALSIVVTKEAWSNWFVDPFSRYSLVCLFFCTGQILLPFLMQHYAEQKGWKAESREAESFLSLNLCGYLFYIVSLFAYQTMYGSRISLFYDAFYVLTMPLMARRTNSRKMTIFLILFLLTDWFVWIIRMGWSGSTYYSIRPF